MWICFKNMSTEDFLYEQILGPKGAAHGFRNLSMVRIQKVFEQRVTQMKTKKDEIVNKGKKVA